MIFFYQKSETQRIIQLPVNSVQSIVYKNIFEGESPSFEQIYMLPTASFNNHLAYMQEHHKDAKLFNVPEEVIKENINLPCMIGNRPDSLLFRNDLNTIEAIEAIYKQKKEKLSILIYSENRFALGDSVVQASVFKNLYDQLIARGVECEFVSYKIINSMDAEFLYTMVFPELKFRYLPATVNEFFYGDFILTDAAYATRFDKDIHDVFAEQLCFELSEDFSIEKTVTSDLHIMKRAKMMYKDRFDNDLPVVVFNKESSSVLRTMPNEIATKIITKLLDSGKMNIVVFDRHSFLDIEHERYAVFSSQTYQLKDYFSFLEASDGLISVDTGSIHIAARMGLPVFGFYSSIDPKIREAHYKKTESVFIDNPEYNNKHHIIGMEEEKSLELWSEIDVDNAVKRIIKKFKKGFF